ncbi:hypothetical protein ACFXKG_26475 [Streptomyces sp. NPDC059255]|uniref:hypothetical protein n=1 Tax=Streptomyces sp. NPDC059255 TaxID=3346793 RepID=UPI0036B2052A
MLPVVLELEADAVALVRIGLDPPGAVTVEGGGLLPEDVGIAAVGPIGHGEADRVVAVVAQREASLVGARVGSVQIAREDILDRSGTAQTLVLRPSGGQ